MRTQYALAMKKNSNDHAAGMPPIAISIIIMALITLVAVAANAQTAQQQINPDKLLVQQVMDGDLVFIEGSIFNDLNGDCLQSGDDKPVKGWQVIAERRGEAYYSKTDAQGNFTFAVAPGKYFISIEGNSSDYYATECSTESQKVNAGKGNKVSRVVFPMVAADPLSAEAVPAAN